MLFPAPFRVVLDACVLYPFTVRDTLLLAAEAAFFQVYWTDEILDEARRNLVANNLMTDEKAAKLVATMKRAFPEATVSGYEPLIASMESHEKDRHVVAAAVKAGAQVIVTDNLRDFRKLPEGLEAQSADEFLSNLFDLDPDSFVALLRRQAAGLKRPPVSFDDLLRGMSKLVPEVISAVRAHIANAIS
jgi:predicted nucleic acid-binding protein